MKITTKISTTLALATLLSSIGIHAEVVECSSNPLFGQNECNVCASQDTIKAQKDGDMYSADIENIEFEWENLSDQFQELIYEDEQEFPTVVSNLKVTKNPDKDVNFWGYSEQIIWTEYEGVNEFYINPGSKVFFRKSKSGSSITVSEKSWPQDGGNVLIKSPLVYRDFQVDSFEESDRQVRNYCTLYKVEAGTGASNTTTEAEPEILTDEVATPEPEIENEAETQTSEDTAVEPEVELESAGPVITGDQTQTPTGTKHIILIAIAAIAGGIFVRRKRLA